MLVLVSHRSQGRAGEGLRSGEITGAPAAAGLVPIPGAEQLRVAATGFALLADPSRLRVLWVLAHGDADVSTLAEVTGVSASAVSQHLAKLRLAGLVQPTRDGRRQVYSVRGGHVRRLVLEALDQAEHQVSGLPDQD
jgi:DNA-binding transcriptional ArsR family regulator